MKNIFLCLMLLTLAGCQKDSGAIQGYVEGEFVAVSPTTGGLLQSLAVAKGQDVKASAPLFSLDLTELRAKQAAAQAAVRRAEAELNDLTKGERPEEIEVILRQKEQAEATLQNAQKEYDRVVPLSKSGAESMTRRDDVVSALATAQARVAELDAQVKAANLGARIDRIEAAQADVDSARQALAQVDKQVQDASPAAPADSIVEDTYFRPGEYVAAGQPVVNLLPPDNVKVRFFVSQKTLPQIKPGQAVSVTCDGCGAAMTARVSYIAPENEYTPPVIFSVESREKLVFMVEAVPEQFSPALHPGLPVSVTLGAQK